MSIGTEQAAVAFLPDDLKLTKNEPSGELDQTK